MNHFGDLLQKAIFATLTNYAPLASAMGGTARVFDHVPEKPVFPYLTIGDEQILDGGNSCNEDVFDVFVDVHTWTGRVGTVSGKLIASQVRAAILQGFAITGWRVSLLKYESERHFRDGDGLRGHGVTTFKIKLEKE